mmetsp:Transcript_12563/g.31756  ORF Transcript_12563/g.31756 Transcript_12563/m.31756 type:complete len:85 (+) Transcript_12563:213-467(+)
MCHAGAKLAELGRRHAKKPGTTPKTRDSYTYCRRSKKHDYFTHVFLDDRMFFGENKCKPTSFDGTDAHTYHAPQYPVLSNRQIR